MSRAIRLSKPERAIIRTLLSGRTDKVAQSVLDKLLASEVVLEAPSCHKALEWMAEELGNRLIPPPKGAAGVFAQISHRIRMLGLDERQIRRAAGAAGDQWTGLIKAESIIRQADRLLAGPAVESVARAGSFGAPISLED